MVKRGEDRKEEQEKWAGKTEKETHRQRSSVPERGERPSAEEKCTRYLLLTENTSPPPAHRVGLVVFGVYRFQSIRPHLLG